MPQLQFQGWHDGLKKVSLTKLLRERADLNLSTARNVVERILDGDTVIVAVDSPDESQALADAATALGAICTIIESPEPASAERE